MLDRIASQPPSPKVCQSALDTAIKKCLTREHNWITEYARISFVESLSQAFEKNDPVIQRMREEVDWTLVGENLIQMTQLYPEEQS